jgi:uncharacterized FlaG/YvyC family protein
LSVLKTEKENLTHENELLKDVKISKEIADRELERLSEKLNEKEQRLDEALAREIQLDTNMMQVKIIRSKLFEISELSIC